LAAQAKVVAPGATLSSSFEELLESRIDGLVIATPSALHAEQAAAALERGIAVFCQKPLGRNREETYRVVKAARQADKLLAVDLSYRFISGVSCIKELIHAGELGNVYAVDLIFHNAYGPDKPWFYDRELSGGGCVIDLGIHLVDLMLWMLDFPLVEHVTSRLFADGEPLRADSGRVEDYAMAQLDLDSSTVAQLSCSWNLHAGCDAVIEVSFYGTSGGATLRNRGGSFFDFTAERFNRTSREVLSAPQGNSRNWEWGGRAAVEWARRLAAGCKFDSQCERLIDVARTLDAIYENSDK
jgi:predicted dehydrogenase